MKTFLINAVSETTPEPVPAFLLSLTTAGTGVATILEWLPPVLGIIATLVGIIAAGIVARKTWKTTEQNTEKHVLEVALMKKQLEDRT